MNPSARGARIIDRYRQKNGAVEELAVSAADAVADLQIWAAHHRLDWDAIIAKAERYALDELRCSSCGREDPAALNAEALCPECAA
ncbi:hypothetical protein ACIOG4_28035 [Streptomyces microflavus]|uniref:hypothetical protein n=1 Tax=Streptomyces microflavus TaxID=1919 RepID=UPI00380EBD8B